MAPVGQPYGYVASIWSFGDRGTINASATAVVSRYLAAPGGTRAAFELGVVAPNTGTLKNLRWNCAATTLTGLGNRITVYLNGTATKFEEIWNGAATSGKQGSGSIPVAKGDTLSVQIQLAAGGGSIIRPLVSVELEMPSAIPWLNNGAGMSYIGSGSVGIGTDSPGEALSVNGTIESITGGFRFPDGTLQTTAFAGPPEPAIPPGSVLAYAGPSAPAGWLLCDGSLIDRVAYPGLFAAIGIAHGEGDGSTTFALPDYRGLFLRGVCGSSGVDPDAADREAMGPGGNVGNAVGSKQGQQTLSHQHALGTGGADSFTMVLKHDPQNTSRLAHFLGDAYNTPELHSTGYQGDGLETRPVNAHVNFLIKA